MTKLLSEHLERKPQEVARILVLDLLDDAVTAAERLENPDDTEALHDFRVALRRLRSSIRAYRPYLKDGVSKKIRKELRSLASSTNTARDVEVQLAWLAAQSDKLSENERRGLTWLVKWLHEKNDEPNAERFERVTAHLARIQRALTKSLSSWRVHLNEARTGNSFREVIGSLIEKQLDSLSAQLRAIASADDDAQVHAARISAKRLRYLLEPMSRPVRQARSPVRQLKELQDVLGDLHDANLLVSTIGAAMEVWALERARRLHRQALQPSPDPTSESERPAAAPGPTGEDEHAGLLALARLLRRRRDGLLREIDSRRHGAQLDRFVAETRELGARLRVAPGHTPSLRRFRLTGLPERLRTESSTLIDEGWLPGQKIEDCLRRERLQGSVRHYRLVRVGSEARDTRISRHVFASLWPLTNGRRLRKERYEITEGDRLWRVDDLGGNVVLAESEVTSGSEELRLPGWLVPYLREELTGPTKIVPPATPHRRSKVKDRAAPARPPARAGTGAESTESHANKVSGNGQGSNGSTGGHTGTRDVSAKTKRDG
ncbi:MAG: CHAD domain-containing protein [Vicinamibacteria bacterium]